VLCLCVLPPNFKFYKMTPPQLIENWFIGDIEANVPAFCTLSSKDVRHVSGGAGVLRKMRRFMKFVEQLGRENGCWVEDRIAASPKGWNIADVKALWAGIEKDFKRKYMSGCKRKDVAAWTTPYNKMKNPREEEE